MIHETFLKSFFFLTKFNFDLEIQDLPREEDEEEERASPPTTITLFNQQ